MAELSVEPCKIAGRPILPIAVLRVRETDHEAAVVIAKGVHQVSVRWWGDRNSARSSKLRQRSPR